MGLADKDKLSCPLLLHMIFFKLCTGYKLVSEKKAHLIRFLPIGNEKRICSLNRSFFLYLLSYYAFNSFTPSSFGLGFFSSFDKNHPAAAIPTKTI